MICGGRENKEYLTFYYYCRPTADVASSRCCCCFCCFGCNLLLPNPLFSSPSESLSFGSGRESKAERELCVRCCVELRDRCFCCIIIIHCLFFLYYIYDGSRGLCTAQPVDSIPWSNERTFDCIRGAQGGSINRWIENHPSKLFFFLSFRPFHSTAAYKKRFFK